MKALIDGVWHGDIADTPELRALPGVAQTVKLDHVKRHYYDDLGLVNPAIVPLGPQVAFA